MQRIAPWHTGELLAFDLETTGVDRFGDVPVSFALVRMLDGRVVARESSLVDPCRPIPSPATEVHGITDERARREGMALVDAVAHVADTLVDASHRGTPVVGMKLDFDLTMVDACLRRHSGVGLADAGFAGPVLDVLVLDRHFDRFRSGRRTLGDLCTHYGVVIEHAHDAVVDAEATLAVMAAMCRRFPELVAATAEDLHWSQMDWHRDWADSFAQWQQGTGLLTLEPCDREWPIAGARADLMEVVRAAG